MKKLRIFFTLAVWMTTMLSATGQAQIGIGLKGGWNYAGLSGVNSVTNATTNKSGYHFGAYTLIKLTKIAIQPEVIFSQQGETYTYSGSDYGTDINYLNIPVMLKLYLIQGLNLQAGPQLGFVTQATGSLKNETTGAITNDQDVKEFLNTTDFAIGMGVGWDLPFGLNITARYNIGISDINKYTGGTVPNNVSTWMGTSESKNQVFQFSVGYRIFKIGD
ncbi:MAG: porin family protein [Bacteroidota bacterium]